MKHTVCHRLVFLRFSPLCLFVRACVHVCTSFIFLQSKPFATLHKLLLSPISYPFLIFLLHSISHINGTCAIHIILECNASILTIARVCVCMCVPLPTQSRPHPNFLTIKIPWKIPLVRECSLYTEPLEPHFQGTTSKNDGCVSTIQWANRRINLWVPLAFQWLENCGEV